MLLLRTTLTAFSTLSSTTLTSYYQNEATISDSVFAESGRTSLHSRAILDRSIVSDTSIICSSPYIIIPRYLQFHSPQNTVPHHNRKARILFIIIAVIVFLFFRIISCRTPNLERSDPGRILSKLDRTKFFLQQVAPAQPSRTTVPYDPSSPPAHPVDPSLLVQYAICKLIDKKEEFDRLRNLKRKSQETSSSTSSATSSSGGSSSKEVQLTWSVSPNDLSHKLGKAKKELLKGARINVVISTKPGGRKYIKGLNLEVDEKRQRLLDDVEVFLCTEKEEKRQEVAVETEAETAAEVRIARRLGEVDWQRGGSAAVMSFECFRR
ncbi:hypothetical protein PHSY_007349 [Pseudozyma hubeiensis SY62]|uniref:Uncharacterized protein n=1 Tax=Pseudozyma hubeiensis (strain SY62) TaxID=1305764 RepID=R9PEG7_PSEHS|nr:hypothetical protein PHSY_007349 [Pseudozyma hubeiensis SY62]GAC99746.1 hypothetical protein PHSY_007349 [Pseudozyma hubeiensis SY62]